MPAPKKTFGLFAFALLVGALLLLWRPWDVPPPALGPAGSEVGDSGAMATDLGAEPQPEREAVQPVAPEESGAGIPVRVVAEATGEPLPGAEVLYYDYERRADLLPQEYEALRATGDEEAMARRLGTSALADSQGMARVSGEWDLLVVGRRGELYGSMVLDPRMMPPEGAWVLELRKDATLRILVLDHRGDPAEGVRIAFAPAWQELGSSTLPTPRARSRTTDSEGIVAFLHAQTWLRPRDPSLTATYSAQPHVPGLVDGQKHFELDEIPVDPIVFQLPPTGRVVLRTVTASGEAFPTMQFEMKVASSRDLADRTTWSDPGGTRWQITQLESEWAPFVFDRVLLDKVYWARAFLGGPSLPPLVFRGPTSADQEVRVDLQLEADLIVLSGRALDENGRALANRWLSLTLVAGGTSGNQVLTDGEGRFRIKHGPAEGGEVELTSLVLVSPGQEPIRRRSERIPARGEIRSSGVLRPGDNDVGDVILMPLPLAARGQVFTDGTPAEEELLVWAYHAPAGGQDWVADRELMVSQAEDGRFAIYGDLQPGRYAVIASTLRHPRSERVEFHQGDRDVRVHLQSGGGLQATVLLDGWRTHSGVRLRLLPKGPEVRRPGTGGTTGIYPPVRDEGSATYVWSGLVPGEYDLEVRVYGKEQPAVLISGIEVPAGSMSDDPRLQAIDLSSEFKILRVTVVDPLGEPIREGGLDAPVVLFQNEAPDAVLEGFTEATGTVEVITTEPLLDLFVAAQGYQPRVVRGVSTDATVALEPWPEIELQIADGLPALPEGVSLSGDLRYLGTRDERQFRTPRTGGALQRDFYPYTEGFQFSELGLGRSSAVPGSLRLILYVSRVTGGASESIRDTMPRNVEVQPGIARQTFQVSIPPEAPAQALERLARR